MWSVDIDMDVQIQPRTVYFQLLGTGTDRYLNGLEGRMNSILLIERTIYQPGTRQKTIIGV